MKYKPSFLSCLVVDIAFISHYHHLSADNATEEEFKIARKDSFFQASNESELKIILPYAKLPDSKNAIDKSNYKQVIREFVWWGK